MIVGGGILEAKGMTATRQIDILRFPLLCRGRRQGRLPVVGIIIARPYLCGPRLHVSIFSVCFFQIVEIAQQMHPTPLVLTGIDVIPSIEIADQVTRKASIQDTFDHHLPPAVIIFIVPDGVIARGGKGPDVPVLSILPPHGFITMEDRTRAGLRFERIDLRLKRAPHAMEEFHQLTDTQVQLVDARQIDCLLYTSRCV